jgi:hypothetical protein
MGRSNDSIPPTKGFPGCEVPPVGEVDREAHLHAEETGSVGGGNRWKFDPGGE